MRHGLVCPGLMGYGKGARAARCLAFFMEEDMPRGTKVSRAETALRKSARKKGLTGERLGRYVYGTLNNLGLKKGNKTTRRGRSKAKSR